MHHQTQGRHVGLIGAGVAIAVIGIATFAAPANPHAHPAPATPNYDQPTTAALIAYPPTITIPASLAHAVGQARENTATACPARRATSWAEIDENGTVDGIYASCTAGP